MCEGKFSIMKIITSGQRHHINSMLNTFYSLIFPIFVGILSI
jgi:hypothetical protein